MHHFKNYSIDDWSHTCENKNLKTLQKKIKKLFFDLEEKKHVFSKAWKAQIMKEMIKNSVQQSRINEIKKK